MAYEYSNPNSLAGYCSVDLPLASVVQAAFRL
jgi:hypothetical protein